MLVTSTSSGTGSELSMMMEADIFDQLIHLSQLQVPQPPPCTLSPITTTSGLQPRARCEALTIAT